MLPVESMMQARAEPVPTSMPMKWSYSAAVNMTPGVYWVSWVSLTDLRSPVDV